jgi:hypothetical protein
VEPGILPSITDAQQIGISIKHRKIRIENDAGVGVLADLQYANFKVLRVPRRPPSLPFSFGLSASDTLLHLEHKPNYTAKSHA